MGFFGSKKGPSGYSANSTAEQVTDGVDGTGLTAIVTGASSGIGVETARVLALRGVHVVMAVRNVEAGKKVREEIITKIPTAKIDVMEADLSSMECVRKFASEYISSGIYGTPFTLSQDKIELQFATNHIGTFLLTNLLLETMKNTARESKIEGKIVNVSSDVHRQTYPEGIRFDKINDKSGYNDMTAYGQSKLAIILYSNELARRLKDEGAEGAATQCYVALNPQVKGLSGEYFEDCNKVTASSQATDVELAKKLWDFSLNLTNPK